MRLKNVFGIVLLLAFGFLLGATYDHFRGSPIQADSRDASRSSMTSRLEEELIRELKLDSQQQLVLQKAIEDARVKLRLLRHEYGPRVGAILDEARDSLVPHLTADQLKLREELIRQKKERRRQKSSSDKGNESESKS